MALRLPLLDRFHCTYLVYNKLQIYLYICTYIPMYVYLYVEKAPSTEDHDDGVDGNCF